MYDHVVLRGELVSLFPGSYFYLQKLNITGIVCVVEQGVAKLVQNGPCAVDVLEGAFAV
jgi:hypothetical protein